MVLASQTFPIIQPLCLVLLATYYAGIIDRYLQTQIEDLVHFPTTPSTVTKLLLDIAHYLSYPTEYQYPQNESVFGKYRGKMNTDYSHPQLHHCSGFMKTLVQIMEIEFL